MFVAEDEICLDHVSLCGLFDVMSDDAVVEANVVMVGGACVAGFIEVFMIRVVTGWQVRSRVCLQMVPW